MSDAILSVGHKQYQACKKILKGKQSPRYKSMSKTWYPVINYELCIECGKCIKKCGHGVYNKAKTPRPVVVFPDGCVQGCHGCGNLCSAGAIEYVGEGNPVNSISCSCDC